MRLLFAFAVLISSVQCLSLKASVSFPHGPKSATPFELNDLNGVDKHDTFPLHDTISINSLREDIVLNIDADESLSQLSLLIGYPAQDLEHTILSKDNKLTIDLQQIPDVLLFKLQNEKDTYGPLLVTLVASDSKIHVLKNLFKIDITEGKKIEVNYKKPERFTELPEILHVFRGDPKTAPSAVAFVFATVIVASIAILFGSLLKADAFNLTNIPKGIDMINFIIGIALIAGFEFVFAQYYFGMSIFKTLEYSAYLGLPLLYVGTKFLRTFGRNI